VRTGSDLRGISLFAKGRSSTATGDLALLSLAIESRLYGQESGTHCNYYRNYDPGIGRYVQSDPIGLAAGINTYGYVKNNPLGKADRLGLAPTIGMTWLPGQLLNWLKPPAPTTGRRRELPCSDSTRLRQGAEAVQGDMPRYLCEQS